MNYLAIDIGGTFIKYCTFNEDGHALSEAQKTRTKVDDHQNYILEQVIAIVKETIAKQKISGVAISSAGVVNSQTGKIEFAGPTIPNYTGTPIAQSIEEIFNIKCTVINDVNAACLGEYWKGFASEEKPKTLACITLGTGVGGAFIIDGRLHEGENFMAGEVGYMPIDGKHYQDLASTNALLKDVALTFGHKMTGEQFFDHLKTSDDPRYQEIFDRFISNIAKGLLIIQYLINPEQIVIGGGILAQHQLIIPALLKNMRENVLNERFMCRTITPAKAGNKAGMLGALYHHLNEA